MKPNRQLPFTSFAVCALILLAASSLNAQTRLTFNGGRAFDDLKHLVNFGPRPAGSAALGESRRWMISVLKATGAQVEEDSFTGDTPIGPIPMANIVAKFPGARPQVVMISGHYDTKLFSDFRFVGANDGASSAALLLELARSLQGRQHDLTYWLVFFDGEEAVREWSDTDSTYGSRHMVQKLSSDGTLGRVQAMILVDMIGATPLDIHRESGSTPWLTDMVFDSAHRLGYTREFLDSPTAFGDDHTPFINAGVPSIDIIDDFDDEPESRYWHTAQDTVEHCSSISMTIVGRVVLATLAELEKSPHTR